MKNRARIMLESLTRDQILRHKKEKSFYIENYDGYFTVNRYGKIIAVDGIEFAETIIKHHCTRNWEIIQTPFTERHPLLSIID